MNRGLMGWGGNDGWMDGWMDVGLGGVGVVGVVGVVGGGGIRYLG